MDQTQSDQINDLAGAIVTAQSKLEPAKKDATNPFFHSKYADLPAVWLALAPFRAEGIAITQSPMESPDGYIILDTQLTHTSGQWMRSRLKMRVAKDDPQGAGSALTYARRYALGCMTGLVTEDDDDGNAASHAPAGKTSDQKFKAVSNQPAPTVSSPPQQSGSLLPPANTWQIPFGKSKGKLLCDVQDGDVDYLMAYYTAKLNEPANATSRYRDEWENAVMEVRAELLRRYPGSQT